MVLGSKSILIVDDDKYILNIFSHILQKHGYIVEPRKRRGEALEKLETKELRFSAHRHDSSRYQRNKHTDKNKETKTRNDKNYHNRVPIKLWAVLKNNFKQVSYLNHIQRNFPLSSKDNLRLKSTL